jgi:hypothetical protein
MWALLCVSSRLAFVEHATLDLAKVISLKLGKITQKQISDFKKEKLSYIGSDELFYYGETVMLNSRYQIVN